MPRERLVAELAERLSTRGSKALTAKVIVQALVDVLGSQTAYTTSYTATELATASLEVGVAFGYLQHVRDEGPAAPSILVSGGTSEAPSLDQTDLAAEIRRAINTAKCRLNKNYVKRVELGGAVLGQYFDAVEYVLTHTYAPGGSTALASAGNESITLYEGLRSQMGDLSRTQYRREHRVRVEYVSKCVRSELFASLRPQLET